MTVTMLLYVLAFLAFILAGFGVSRPPLRWEWLGVACLTLALLILK